MSKKCVEGARPDLTQIFPPRSYGVEKSKKVWPCGELTPNTNVRDISPQILDTAEARPGLAQICPHDSSCGQIKKGPALRTQFLDTAKIIILASAVVLSVNYVFAWSGAPAGGPPPAPCPAGSPGCDPPVNVGSVLQTKTGDFVAASLQALAIGAVDILGNTDVSIGGTANGIIVHDGDIAASNGAVKGASIENLAGTAQIDSSGNVKGASFNVGSSEVISSSKVGTFSGGVVVGDTTDTATPRYFQVDAVNVNIPPSADCNSPEEYGKIVYDIDSHFLYICGKDSAAPTWRRVSTNTP